MDLDGIEHVDVRTLGGADTVTVGDLTGTDLEDGQRRPQRASTAAATARPTRVIVNGTDGADDVDVCSERRPRSSTARPRRVARHRRRAALDSVDVATLGGDDTIDRGRRRHRPAAGARRRRRRAPTRATYNGTAGDDTIGIARNGTAAVADVRARRRSLINNTAVEELVVSGLGGADTITGQNGIGTLDRT